MALNFPNSPTNGQTYTLGDRTWSYNSTKGVWDLVSINDTLRNGARVTKTAAQSLTTATLTTLTWDSEVYDDNTFHDNITNNSRLTISDDGKYIVTLAVDFASNNTGTRQIGIYKNGTVIRQIVMPNNSAGQDYLSITDIIYLVAGDYIEGKATQSSGGALDVDITSSFTIARMG